VVSEITLRIPYSHVCPNCGAYYIPYGKNVPCPKCGLVEEERFEDFISKAALALLYNYANYGSFSIPPEEWSPVTLSEYIVHVVSVLFDYYKQKKGDFEKFTEEFLDLFEEWGEHSYLKKHIKDIALEVYKVVSKNLSGEI